MKGRVKEIEGNLKASTVATRTKEGQLAELRRRFEVVDGARERALNAVAGVRGIMREYDAATHAAALGSAVGPVGSGAMLVMPYLVGGPSCAPEVVDEPVVNVVVEKPAERDGKRAVRRDA